MEAMKWHLLPERRLQMASARTRPRKATLGRLLVVGGMDKNKGATTIESYDPRCRVDDELQLALLAEILRQLLHQQGGEAGTGAASEGVEDEEAL
ncbi:hypothetical protein NQ315_012606 [Exocentrus adspersus]|uniref:Uncharacterized protein n=1 Tax=Exocentrus adspersus TaxID=1586481 RepID=A0AAV8VRW5_9CUCU|nr:hypothetical protein NQ315_012606 [Exocentrus adspersus]